ncbi:zinc finger, GRF-type containing protein, partial [Tanacetum coccineum]
TQTSWTDTNSGRRFLACPQINGERCIYFDWVDPPMCQRSMMIIPGLLKVRNRMEADMMVLVQANRNLKKYLIIS